MAARRPEHLFPRSRWASPGTGDAWIVARILGLRLSNWTTSVGLRIQANGPRAFPLKFTLVPLIEIKPPIVAFGQFVSLSVLFALLLEDWQCFIDLYLPRWAA
jgi:hypothetical protein